jgi:hypothetical protein
MPAEAAFRDYCRFRAEDAWRQAATVRRTGIRQLPRALIMAAVAAAVAAACSYLGASLDGKAAAALPYVIAGIGVIAAWVIVWMPIEEPLFDWRPPAHVVAVFGPLSRARLEFIRQRTPDRCAVHSPGPQDPSDTAHRRSRRSMSSRSPPAATTSQQAACVFAHDAESRSDDPS